MTNMFFPDEQIGVDDLYFVCYMIERVARNLKQPNKYVANSIGHDELVRNLSLADVLHAENPLAVEHKWIEEYQLEPGNYDVSKVDANLCEKIPTALQMAKVYKRLIITRVHTMSPLLTLQGAILPVASDEMLNYSPSCSWQ